jgi:hypothetical protein
MSWSRARRSFKDSVKVRSSGIGKRTHLEDATMRSACHRVIVKQDEGNIAKRMGFYRGMTTEWMGMACSGRKFRMESVSLPVYGCASFPMASPSAGASLWAGAHRCQMLFVRPVAVENDMASHRRAPYCITNFIRNTEFYFQR